MTDKRIVFELPDGSLIITTPVTGSESHKSSKTEEEWFNKEAEKIIKKGSIPSNAIRKQNYSVSNFPSFYFRKVWRIGINGKIQVDMNLAKTQKMEEIRIERNRLLDDSDKENARIQDIGTSDQKIDMSIYRQSLRDLPNNLVINGTLDTLTTPEELEAFQVIWPDLNI